MRAPMFHEHAGRGALRREACSRGRWTAMRAGCAVVKDTFGGRGQRRGGVVAVQVAA